MRSVRGFVPKKELKDTDKACPLPLLSVCVGTTGSAHCRGALMGLHFLD